MNLQNKQKAQEQENPFLDCPIPAPVISKASGLAVCGAGVLINILFAYHYSTRSAGGMQGKSTVFLGSLVLLYTILYTKS